jgi:hypothetical protein
MLSTEMYSSQKYQHGYRRQDHAAKVFNTCTDTGVTLAPTTRSIQDEVVRTRELIWKFLKTEIETFRINGLLLASPNRKIQIQERFRNHSKEGFRRVSSLIYSRLERITREELRSILPPEINDICRIVSDRQPKYPAWFHPTPSIRRSYDQQYWIMRQQRLSYSPRYPLSRILKMSRWEWKAYSRFMEEAVQRNRYLKHPPPGLLETKC